MFNPNYYQPTTTNQYGCQSAPYPPFAYPQHYNQPTHYNPPYFVPPQQGAHHHAMPFQAQQMHSLNPHIAQIFAQTFPLSPPALSQVLLAHPLRPQPMPPRPFPLPMQPQPLLANLSPPQPLVPFSDQALNDVNNKECEESPEQILFAEGIVRYLEKEEKISESKLETFFGQV